MSVLQSIKSGEVNAVGELLRAATFPEHNPEGEGDAWAVGAYTVFDVREDAYEWSKEAVKAFFDLYLEDGLEDRGQGVSFDLDGLRVDLARFYEGDSVLAYSVFDQEGNLVRAVENWDAKKNYVWREMSEDDIQAFAAVRELLPVVHVPSAPLDRSPRARLSELADAT